MKIRCELHLGGHTSKVILAAKPEEKVDHLALKLAAIAMFLSQQPIVEPSSDHPSLYGFDIKPDVFVLGDGGEIKTWIECGMVSINKLDKVTRRLPQTRIIVLKSQISEAQRLRSQLKEEVRHGSRIEIWSWPDGLFKSWLQALAEKTELYGEAHEKSFNLVVNDLAYVAELVEA